MLRSIGRASMAKLWQTVVVRKEQSVVDVTEGDWEAKMKVKNCS
jgi:hypothetical protein